MLVPLPNHERMLALAMQARIKCGKTKARVIDGLIGRKAQKEEAEEDRKQSLAMTLARKRIAATMTPRARVSNGR